MERLNNLGLHKTTANQTQVCLIAGSKGNHMNIAWIGNKPEFRINLLTRRPELFSSMEITGHYKNIPGKTITGKINEVSSDPAKVCPGSQVFILSCPVNAQEYLLRKIKPYVPTGAFVGSVFGQGGFDLIAKNVFGEDIKKKNITIWSLFNIPSTTVLKEEGKSCVILGPKKYLAVCSYPSSKKSEAKQLVERLWGTPTIIIPNFLNIMLTPGNQIIHSGRIKGFFEGKDITKPLPEKPAFYVRMDQRSADNMARLSSEIQLIKYKILSLYPNFDLKKVLPLDQRILEQYGDMVEDRSSLRTIFSSNKGYTLFTIPMKKVEGGFVLNTEARIFTEDVPFGLCVLKDIAEKLNLEVPNITEAIVWHQQYMGKQFIVDGKLNPVLIPETGTPRRFGINTIEELIEYYSK